MTDSWVFWTTLAALFGGFVIGWNLGLWRAAKSYREAAIAPLRPTREAAIKDCLDALVALRNERAALLERNSEWRWRQHGIDAAIDAVMAIDKRGAGHYGVPRSLADFISRRALDRAANGNAREEQK